MIASMGFGLKELRGTVAEAAGQFQAAASDTKTAMTALGILGVAALAVAVIALVVAAKARTAS